MARAIVVGGGVGGLATAIRLRAAGHAVTVLERNEVVGGKLAAYRRDGYTFDVGPSLVTWPEVYDDVFRVAGTSLAEQVELVRLDPQFRYRWPDGSTLVVPDGDDDTADAFEAFSPGGGDQWRRFDAHGRRIWDVAVRTFFAGPMSNPWALARRLRSPFDLTAIDPMRTLHRAGESFFDDPRLVQWADRYATYSGSSPFAAPATLACIPHIEARYGCWYPSGGLDALREAFERVAIDRGVEIRTGTEVATIDAADRVESVTLSDGSRERADIVVANTDAEHLYTDLLPDTDALKRARRATRSTSGFVLCLGVRGLTPALAHHNVWFSDGYEAEYAALDAGRLADDPTIYACVSSVTDPSQAPDGCENWFLLVNTPQGVDVDREAYGDLVLDRLRGHGVDLRPRIEFRHSITPTDIAERYRTAGGAIYGTSSNGKRAAFVRPANRGARPGLYLVGGSSHPGGGLPLVTTSARIVADMIAEDLA
ncbi:MAG TPA: phytoene desaturase family protein [Ilumatobacteraceae bacterium]|nr:phytoene desaturase family protein [Ilumatobacteraceae bacterium]